MSGHKEWPELVGQTFATASAAILQFDSSKFFYSIYTSLYSQNSFIDLHPYNARNGIQNRMFDPFRVVCVTNDQDIITEVPSYTRR